MAAYSAPMRTLVLQHIACEPPGVFEDVLNERGAELHRVELDEGEPLPDWREFDAIVAMGGPMSVWTTTRCRGSQTRSARSARPFAPELRTGACAWAFSSSPHRSERGSTRGRSPRSGCCPVSMTGEARSDPVFGEAPHELVTLQWHGDTFDLPDGAVRLASSPAYANQAFRFERAYGVQFHLEVSAEMAREWAEVPEYVASLERTFGAEAAPTFLAAIEARADEMRSTGRALFERWLDRVVAT